MPWKDEASGEWEGSCGLSTSCSQVCSTAGSFSYRPTPRTRNEADPAEHLNSGPGREALRVARHQAAEAASLRDQHARELAVAQRERRIAAQTLSEVQAAIAAAEAERSAKESDCRGLRRTLERIHSKLGGAVQETDQSRPPQMQIQDDFEIYEIEERALLQNIASVQEVGNTFRRRLQAEREKRLRLKASARAKLERVEESNAQLRRSVQKREQEVEALKAQVCGQQKALQAALEEQRQCEEDLTASKWRHQERYNEKRQLQLEVLNLEQQHEQMRKEHTSMLDSIQLKAEKRREARRGWNLQHLARVDARTERHRSFDQDFMVA